MTWPVVHVSQPVDADPDRVIGVAGEPRRLPEWAAGLSAGIRLEGDHWLTDSPMGTVEVAFTGDVERGILDHDVTLPDGTVVHNPLRILPNGTGSEVVFSVFRLPGTTAEAFDADVATVRDDLARLRTLVEAPPTD